MFLFHSKKYINKAAWELGHTISRFKANTGLRDEAAYSLQKPIKHTFTRNRWLQRGRYSLWDIDLADVSNIKNTTLEFNFGSFP